MLKLVGCVVLICSTTMIGASLSSRKKRRICELEAIIKMLSEISIMISFSSAPVYEIAKNLRKNTDLFCLEFISQLELSVEVPFAESFKTAVIASHTALNDDDKGLLISFGAELGGSGVSEQKSLTAMYKSFFADRLLTAKADCERKCRVISSLGVLSGVFLSIMLV